MSDTVIVKVRDGILRAFEASDPDYPGIWVEFVANNDCQSNDLSRPSVLMERPLGGELRALIWADKNNEDYTEEVVFQSDLSAVSR